MNTITPAEYKALHAPKKPSKYRAQRTEVDGIKFDSKAEAEYYGKLKLMAAAGQITGYDLQVPFEIIVHGQLITRYIADFLVYYPDGSQKIKDVKGYRQEQAHKIFEIKRKLMKALYDLDIEVVTKN